MINMRLDEQFNATYISARQLDDGPLGYGLRRRTGMLLSAIDRMLPTIARPRLDVIDFGCADALMLRAAARALGERYGSGLALDVFRAGAPADVDAMRFLAVDLFETFPYPVESASTDIAIASAFMKHHPDNRRFLEQVARVLRPGGFAVLLDPRPFVVKVGMRIGKFSRQYNPSLWSPRSVQALLSDAGIALQPVYAERYWVAPTQALYDTGFERWLPGPLSNLLALHQCMCLKRI